MDKVSGFNIDTAGGDWTLRMESNEHDGWYVTVGIPEDCEENEIVFDLDDLIEGLTYIRSNIPLPEEEE